MVEIFIATSGRARPNPVTRDVLLDFENGNLEEVTIQLPFANLQLLTRQAAEGIGSEEHQPSNGDPLPLGGMYRITSHIVSRIPSMVRLTIHFESDSGTRFLDLDLSPQGASLLADDLYEKAS